jgi:dimethylamine/trimethylamine dehydrogenase
MTSSAPRSRRACTPTATAGEEYRRGWHPERFEPAENRDRDVLVVGAGPAGMECAIVLGKRGFRRVHLVDAGDEIGGIMRWVPRLPGLGEWGRVLNWRAVQLEKLRNVEILTGSRLEAKDVREYGAELVVVATGARWAADGLNFATHEPIPGADASLPHVLTPEQVMVEGKAPPAEKVVVYDGEGYFVGAGLAEKLAGDGFSVELVSALEKVAPICDETLEGPMLRQHLHDVGVRQRTGVALTGIEPGRLAAMDEFGEPLELEADAVVLVTQRLSNEELYLELRSDEEALAAEGIEALYRIGDCVAPRLIADAIFDGHRLAREIDAENPAIPLPYRRERILFEPAGLRA